MGKNRSLEHHFYERMKINAQIITLLELSINEIVNIYLNIQHHEHDIKPIDSDKSKDDKLRSLVFDMEHKLKDLQLAQQRLINGILYY